MQIGSWTSHLHGKVTVTLPLAEVGAEMHKDMSDVTQGEWQATPLRPKPG